MNKKLFLGLFFVVTLLLTITSVFAAGDLSVNPLSSTISVADLSQTQTTSITVTNTGAHSLSVNKVLMGFNTATYTLPQASFTYDASFPFILAPAGTKTIVVSLNLAGTNAYISDYVGKLNLTTNLTGSYSFDTITVQVTDSKPDVNVNSVTASVAAGLSATPTLTIENKGNTDLTGVLVSSSNLVSSTNTITASAVTFNQNNFNLNYGQQKTITVTVATQGTTATGVYTGTLTITSGSMTKQVPITITVLSPSSFIGVQSQTVTGDPSREFTTTVTVANTGAVDYNNLAVTFTGSYSAMRLNASPTIFSLPAGSTYQITINGIIPVDIDTSGSGTTANIIVSNSQVSSRGVLTVKGRGMLDMSEVKVKYGSRSKSISDGTEVRNVRPGDTVTVSGKVRNRFSSSTNIYINSIDVTLTGDGRDLTVDETDNVGDLRYGSTKNFEMSFDIDSANDEETLNLELIAEGIDENGARHKNTMNFDLRIEKVTDDVKVSSYSISPSIVTCNRNVDFNIRIQNVGGDDQNQAALTIINPELGINFKEDLITLDASTDSDQNEYSKTFRYTLSNSVKPASYDVKFTGYYDDDKATDTKIGTLIIQDCGSNPQTTTTTYQGTTVPTTVPVTTIAFNTGQQPVNYAKPAKDTYTVVLIAAIIIIVIAAIAMIAYLLKGK